MVQEVRRLVSIGLYDAPHQAEVKPRVIARNSEHLQLVIGGQAIVRNNGKDDIFSKGAFFWFVSGERAAYRTVAEDPMRLLVIRFETENNPPPVTTTVNIWPDLQSFDLFVAEIFQAIHRPNCDREELCRYICATLRWKSVVQKKFGDDLHYPLSLRKALIFIGNRYALNISTEDIAANSEISKPYLFLLFRRYLNSSPHQYLLEYRLVKAREKLCSSMRSVKEISNECGFANIETFYRHFRENYGQSPGKYRESFSPFAF